MQFLLFLVAIGVVVYGVVASSLAWVIAGMLAVGILFSGRFGTMTAEDAKRFNRLAKSVLGPPWRQLLLAALLCSGVAGWIFHQDRHTLTSLYFWLAALCLVLGAGFVHDRKRLDHTDRDIDPIEGPAVVNAIVNAVFNGEQRQWTLVDWGIAAFLAVIALGLRLYQIGIYLPPIHGDEGEMGMLALRALHGATFNLATNSDTQRLPFFSTAFLDHPTLFHYVQALGMWLFGETITALRIVSAFFGALCAPLLYAIGRAGWGRIAGLTAGWLIAVSHLHIHYSRIALNNIETVVFVILLMWLLALVHESRQPQLTPVDRETDEAEARSPKQPALLRFMVIGLVIGLGQYFYYGSRLMPVLAVVLLIALWRQRKVTLLQATVLVAAALVAYFPLALYYANDLPAFFDRMRGVSVFTAKGLAHTLGPEASWPNDIPTLLWTQIKLNLYFFLHYGDRSGFYLADIPAFDRITVILFWLGLGMVLANVRRYHELALVTWLGIGVMLAGVFTTDAPYGPRLVIAVPAIYLIGGVFLQNAHHFLSKVWPKSSRRVEMLVLSLIAASTLYLNFNTYFVQYQQNQPNLAQVYIAQAIADSATEYRAYLLGAPNLYVNYGTIRLLAVATEKYDLETSEQFTDMLAQQTADKGAMLIALPQHFDDLEQIERLFPHGTKSERKNLQGIVLYMTYQIPADELTRQSP